MKRLLLIVFVCLCITTMAFAQAGGIMTTSDEALCSCNFLDVAPGIIYVYISHLWTLGATASQFMLEVPSSWVHLGDTWNFPTVIGSSVTGVSVAYGACLAQPIILGTANFFGSGLTAPCTKLSIVADPAAPSGMIEGVDCSEPPAKTYPTGGMGFVNDDGGCWCGGSPVENTTWGGVKALYR